MRAPLFSRRTSKCRFAVWRFILEPFANQAPWQIQIQWNTAQLKGSCWWIFAWHECDCVYFFPTAIDSRRWTGQRVRCFMLVSVDVPLYGLLEVALTASSTAGDIIYLLRERLPDCPWHGNKLLSSGICQLQCDDIVEAAHHSDLVFTNYSEISNKETRILHSKA